MTLTTETCRPWQRMTLAGLLAAVACGGLACFETIRVDEDDLRNVPNGEYIGRYQDSRWQYGVAVTVRDGKMRAISAPMVARGPAGTLSRQILPKVIVAQSTDVDTISGATRESEGLLRAIENAIP